MTSDNFMERLVKNDKGEIYDPVTDTVFDDWTEAEEEFETNKHMFTIQEEIAKDKKFNIENNNVERFQKIHKIILNFLKKNNITDYQTEEYDNVIIFMYLGFFRLDENQEINIVKQKFPKTKNMIIGKEIQRTEIDTKEIIPQIVTILKEMNGILQVGLPTQKKGSLSMNCNMKIKNIFEEEPKIYFE